MLRQVLLLFSLWVSVGKLALFDHRIGLTQNSAWLVQRVRGPIQRRAARLTKAGKRVAYTVARPFVRMMRPRPRRHRARSSELSVSMPGKLNFMLPSMGMFIMFHLGNFHTLRRTCLKIMRHSRKSPNALYVLSASYLLRMTTRRYSWSVEYDSYRRDGSFFDPKILVGHHRYLGDVSILRARLRLLMALTERAATDAAALSLCADAAVALDDAAAFRRLHKKLNALHHTHTHHKPWVAYAGRLWLNTGKDSAFTKAIELAELYYYNYLIGFHSSIHAMGIYERVPRAQEFDPTPLMPAHSIDYEYDVLYDQETTRFATRFDFPAVAAHRIKNARLLHYHGLIVSGDKCIERFFHLKDYYLEIFCPHMAAKGDERAVIAARKDGPLKIHGPVFFCGFTDNYYHWLIECLPRYVLALEMMEAQGYPKRFLLPLPPAKWQWKMLQAIGIEPVHCLIDSEVKGYVCEEMIAVDHLSFDMVSNPRTFDILKRRLPPEWLAARDQPPTRKLLIVRPKNALTRFHSQKRIVKLAEAYGFETVSPELLSFEDQIRLFSQASHVLGAGGAAFGNLVFTPPGCKAAIFAPLDQLHPGTFGPLVAGHREPLSCLMSQSAATITMPPYIWTVFDYSASHKEIAYGLQRIMGESA